MSKKNSRKPHLFSAFALTLALSPLGCDGDTEAPASASETTGAEVTPHVAVPRQAAAKVKHGDAHRHKMEPRIAPQGRQSFDQVMELIETKYVDGPLSQDELWTAATEGVLARLIQTDEHAINTLLSPQELADLMEGTRGSIVGVGIAIEDVGGTLVIRELVPGGPSVESGLQPGDRILGIDGERLRGKSLRDSVMKIRGEAGTKVDLFVQRDTEEWTVTIERAPVAVASVLSRNFDDGVGYLRLNGFSKSTGEEADKHLEALKQGGMTRLVLDLRACPGGLLDSAMEVAELFLAPEQRIVTIRGVKGEEHRAASEQDGWEELPLVVLIGPKTASGGEILASALQDHQRGALIGQPTFGKGTVEGVHELESGWAVKLSAARFFSPKGDARQDNPVVPDFVTELADGHKLPRVEDMSIGSDPALATGMGLLSRR